MNALVGSALTVRGKHCKRRDEDWHGAVNLRLEHRGATRARIDQARRSRTIVALQSYVGMWAGHSLSDCGQRTSLSASDVWMVALAIKRGQWVTILSLQAGRRKEPPALVGALRTTARRMAFEFVVPRSPCAARLLLSCLPDLSHLLKVLVALLPRQPASSPSATPR